MGHAKVFFSLKPSFLFWFFFLNISFMLIQSTYLIFRFLLNCKSWTKSNWEHWDSVFPKQNRGSSQMPMAEEPGCGLTATDEGTQHRAKIRLEKLTSSDSVQRKCSYDNFRHNLSLAAGWLPHKPCQLQIAVCSILVLASRGAQSQLRLPARPFGLRLALAWYLGVYTILLCTLCSASVY